jgi:hypothetical protein
MPLSSSFTVFWPPSVGIDHWLERLKLPPKLVGVRLYWFPLPAYSVPVKAFNVSFTLRRSWSRCEK